MKTINYTGSSKLISRIVNLLNKKVPLPLDGDGNPDWGTNGQFLTTDGAGGTTWSSGGGGGDTVSWTQTQASGTKIAEIDINGTSQNVYVPTAPTVNDGTLTIQQNGTTVGTFSANQSGDTTVNLTGGGSGGHTIWNRIKTALYARANLWFADASVSDVSADDATKVEVVTELLNETAFDNLATDGTADGIYTFPDSGGEYLTAEMVGYENTNVKAALDGKVSKSGDTMTGMLTIDRSADDGTQRCLALRSGTSGIAYLTLFDKTNTQLGSLGFNAQNNPVFRTSGGTVKKLSTRTVATLVDESVNLAQSGSKTYATLTTTYLSQFDEVTFLCNWGSPVGALVMTKAMISKTATVYGSSGAVGISSGSHYGSFAFGSSGMVVHNSSSTTMVSLLVEGITY